MFICSLLLLIRSASKEEVEKVLNDAVLDQKISEHREHPISIVDISYVARLALRVSGPRAGDLLSHLRLLMIPTFLMPNLFVQCFYAYRLQYLSTPYLLQSLMSCIKYGEAGINDFLQFTRTYTQIPESLDVDSVFQFAILNPPTLLLGIYSSIAAKHLNTSKFSQPFTVQWGTHNLAQ